MSDTEEKTVLNSGDIPKTYESIQESPIALKKDGLSEEEKNKFLKRRFYDILLILGYLACFLPAISSALTAPVGIFLLLCIVLSFFDENFYVYAALFMYVRYQLLLGDSPVYRVYSYLVVAKLLTEIFKTKFKVAYFPAIFVIALHSLTVFPPIASKFYEVSKLDGYIRGLNVVVDCILIYFISLRITEKDELLRKFLFVFIFGAMISGFNSLVNPELTVDIGISGAGVHTVSRSFGLLSDSNFAGLYYGLGCICSISMKGIPAWLKALLVFAFIVLILMTASLSAILVLILLVIFYIILKFRLKSVFILTAVFVLFSIALILLLSIPQFEEIEMISGLIIRIKEKLSYIPRHRWDLLTTDRTTLWGIAVTALSKKNIVGLLIGGSVVTIMGSDTTIISSSFHNSYLQSLLNFGIIGTILVYVPLLLVFAARLYKHFSQKSGYEGEDMRITQMLFTFAFVVFGITIDFFIDWPFMLFYFL